MNGSVVSVATQYVTEPHERRERLVCLGRLQRRQSTPAGPAGANSYAPDTALLSYSINLPQLLGTPDAYVGFTAGTGAGNEDQDILSWQFDNTYAPIGSAAAEQLTVTGVSATTTTNQASTTTTVTWSVSSGILTVYGTGGNDTFTAGAESGQYILNGVTYTYNPANVNVIDFLGQGGTDNAYITGTSAADTAILSPSSGELYGALANPSGFHQVVTLTATVSAGSSGTPTGTVTFSEGAVVLGTSLLSDTGVATFTTTSLIAAAHTITASYGGDTNFTGSSASQSLRTVAPSEYVIDVSAVANIVVTGGGGDDVAYLTDTGGNNTFNGTPTKSWLDGNGFHNETIGFQAVYATAGDGSHDVAYLTDTGGNNTFNGTPTNSWLIGTGYLNDAQGFHAVYATAGSGQP